MRTPPIEMLALLEEAATVFTIPRETDIKKMSETYAKILGWFTMEVLQQALQEYLTTQSRRFPRPADLFPLAKRIESTPVANTLSETHMQWYQDGMHTPCPVCGSVLEFPGPDEKATTKIHHDAQQHREASVPMIGPRT